MPSLGSTLTVCGPGVGYGSFLSVRDLSPHLCVSPEFQALGEGQPRPQIAEPRLLAGKVRTCQCARHNRICPGSGSPVCRVLTRPLCWRKSYPPPSQSPWSFPQLYLRLVGFLARTERLELEEKGGGTGAGKAPKSVSTKCHVDNSSAPSPKPWAPRQASYCP